MAHETGAIKQRRSRAGRVDTTVQEKAIAHPTDARLMHRAIEKLVAGQTRGHRTAPELSARGQARRHHGGALRPCPPVQARPAGAQDSCAPGSAASSATSAARSRATLRSRIALARCSISATGFAIKSSASADRRSTVARPRGGVHRQGQGPRALRVRRARSRLPRLPPRQGRPVRAACQGAARQSV